MVMEVRMSGRDAQMGTGDSRGGWIPPNREGAMTYNSMYSELVTEAPQLAKTYNNLASVGPLDAKTRRLVKLGVAAGLALEGGVRYHAGKALHEGVPPDELRHAVTLALIMAGPGTVRVLKWTEETISCNTTVPKSGLGNLLREKYGENVDGQRIEDGIRGI
jgi:alkylhydroperoxidase/carboxymuconolactone decarboxylase family protein YurZ